FIAWTSDGERDAILSFDLGIMPLRDDQRSRGRCGYKAIEYMAAGLPVVASPVGATSEVVDDGVTGFLPNGPAAWEDRLRALAGDVELRSTMGRAGRARVGERFSVRSTLPLLLDVFDRRVRS